MTSSSSPALERGLDAMLVVYSLLQGHPASPACEQFVRSQTGWFTSPLVLFEAKNILTRVYSVDASAATSKVLQFGTGPIVLLDLDPLGVTSAFGLADSHGLDLTDAHLLHLAQQHGAMEVATEDQRLAQVCSQLGITPRLPLDFALRQQVAAWEIAHLSSKGVPRVLRRIHQWLSQRHLQAAQDFWSDTGSGSHLP